MLRKVLIIEDDSALRASVEQTLELADLTPIATSSFIQARRSIRSNFAGVVLSDIKMPDHSGFEILEFIQKKDPDLPVILFTGHSDVPTAMRAMKQGAYDYLEKPCEPKKLVDTLSRSLKHRALVLENRLMLEERNRSLPSNNQGSLTEQLEDQERHIIIETLRAENGQVAKAAERLDIPRNTLYDRMSKLNIIAKAYRAKP